MKTTVVSCCRAAGFAIAVLLAGCASRSPDSVDQQAAQFGQDTETLQANAAKSAAAGDYAQAIALYQRLVADQPQRADMWFLLGGVHLRNREPEPAQRAFEQALRVDPKLTKSYANLALAHLAQFREAASKAIVSEQVSDTNRAALRSLLLDVDQALFPAAGSAQKVVKP